MMVLVDISKAESLSIQRVGCVLTMGISSSAISDLPDVTSTYVEVQKHGRRL